MKRLVLCIDLGSSSVRCSLYRLPDEGTKTVQPFDETESISMAWEAVHAETGKVRLQQPRVDGTTISLFDLVDQCIDATLVQLSLASEVRIAAIGFSSLVMNLIGVDKEGNPVGEEATLSYACNLPVVSAKVNELQSQLGQDALQELHQKTGAPLHSAYALPQLKVLYESHAPLVQRVSRWHTLSTHCLARWIASEESWPISSSEASWTGLLSVQHPLTYQSFALALLPAACREALPAVIHFDDLPESLNFRPSYAQRWPHLQEARIFLGVGDGACANVGSKCATAHRIACTIGTSAAARVVVRASEFAQRIPQGLFCYRIDHDHLLLGGALTDGGSVIAWARQLLHIQSDKEMQACLAEVDQLLLRDYALAAEGNFLQRPLVMLPFLSGERSTNYQTGATGAIMGLTRATTRIDLLKACLEGVTLRLATIVRLLPPHAPIWVSGRALEVNTVWRQMLADCTGRTIVLDFDTQEGSSRGVAVLIDASLRGVDLEVEMPSASVIEMNPRPEGKWYWARHARTQESFLEAMKPIYAKNECSE